MRILHTHAARLGAFLALTTLSLAALPAAAQDDVKPEFVPETVSEGNAEKQGWDATLSIGANANVTSNESVIGQPDGSSWTLGFNVKSGLQYISGGHESKNTLNLSETFTRTPVVPEFVRTTDLLEFESIYYYHFEKAKWLGPFARFKLQTSIFEGEDVQPEEREYLITPLEGEPESKTVDRLKLTDPFFPLTLRESLGMFARPLSQSFLSLEFRLGLGAREVFAGEQLALKDDDATAPIEVIELESYTQAGAEAVAEARGKIAGDRITYAAGAEYLVPFYNSRESTENLSAFELANTELYASLSFKLVSWASLDYEFKAVKQPLLFDEFQIQHNLLFTVGYTLLEADE